MTGEDHKVDALYEIAREIKKASLNIEAQLTSIRAHLEDISAGIASVSKEINNNGPKLE